MIGQTGGMFNKVNHESYCMMWLKYYAKYYATNQVIEPLADCREACAVMHDLWSK